MFISRSAFTQRSRTKKISAAYKKKKKKKMRGKLSFALVFLF
jgi:hypothetical protein